MRAIALALGFALIVSIAWAQSQPFQPNNDPVVNQGYSSAAITPSDTVNIKVTRAIYNGNATACNIAMQLNGDTASVVWSNVPSGAILPVQAVLVKSTLTTCGTLVAIY